MIRSFDKYLRDLKPKYDDDVVDRCNYLLTNIMLLICAITIAAKQYVGEPLQCWTPAEFQDSWEQYIENFCFIENTYFVPFTDDMPVDSNERNQYQIQYYQWIPFILILQALLFLAPRTIWTMFNWRTGAILTSVTNIKYNIINGYRSFSSYKPSYFLHLGPSGQCSIGGQVRLSMQAIVDAAILTRKVGEKRCLKKRRENREDSFTQAQQIAYVMDFNRRKNQYAKLMDDSLKSAESVDNVICTGVDNERE
ncbi:hypothetical protein LOAG_18253 [Loa loa]|uniref:Innexin n=1 Tax=Loa loa TaxID=7209 RepID=A0A1S0UFH2_LOALO|nr:hypothetical protein LOAG_18253 [Loa loa]EJD74432.1 hypothetical protein LOAG_18253 [Loa loa]